MHNTWKVLPLTQHIGAEVQGADLASRLSEQACSSLRDILLEHHVVFFRKQFLTPVQLVELARMFGEIEVNPFSPKVDGLPEVTELITYDGGSPDIWHFDTSFLANPPMGSILSMAKSPAVGGDTLWISGHAAFEALSLPMREFLTPLSVLYDSAVRARPGHQAEHSIVKAHPNWGRPTLYFDPMYSTRIPQLGRIESEAVLQFLRGFVTDPTFACRHRWRNGDIAFWDNRCTLHRVASDFVGERIIQRVTLAGEC